jgi:hypothetical protein
MEYGTITREHGITIAKTKSYGLYDAVRVRLSGSLISEQWYTDRDAYTVEQIIQKAKLSVKRKMKRRQVKVQSIQKELTILQSTLEVLDLP